MRQRLWWYRLAFQSVFALLCPFDSIQESVVRLAESARQTLASPKEIALVAASICKALLVQISTNCLDCGRDACRFVKCELAEKIKALRPGLPVLFFSAYSDQEILRPVIARRLLKKSFTS